jgi:hypothetical protein
MAEGESTPSTISKTSTNKARWLRWTLYALSVVAGYWIGHILRAGAPTGQHDDQLARCARHSRVNRFVESMMNTVNAVGDTVRMDVDLGDGRVLALCGRVFPEGAAPSVDAPVSWPGAVSGRVEDVLKDRGSGDSLPEMETESGLTEDGRQK